MRLREGSSHTIHCNACGHATKHFVACLQDLNEDRERVIFCCDDCYSPQMRWAERDASPPVERYFPAHDVRSLPSWVGELPTHMEGLLRETHRAFAESHLWLVAMGSRTLIDMFALEKVGDTGGFKAKLSRLQIEGYLSARDVLVVTSAVEVGHEATHRNLRPTAEDCHAVLDIVEHLLQRLSIEKRASGLLQSRSTDPAAK